MVCERTFIFHIWAETSCEVWLGWGPLASFILTPGEQHVSFNLGSKMEKHMEVSPPKFQFSSVQFSCSVVSDSLWLHEPQHTRPSCPSPTPGVHPNPCSWSRWCHLTISSSVIPFSSCPQSFPASGSFQMSQLFASGGQSIGVSASTSVLPMNTQARSLLGWTGWISLQSKGLSRVFSTPQFKSINSSALSFPYSPTLTSIHDYWRNHSLETEPNCDITCRRKTIVVNHWALGFICYKLEEVREFMDLGSDKRIYHLLCPHKLRIIFYFSDFIDSYISLFQHRLYLTV